MSHSSEAPVAHVDATLGAAALAIQPANPSGDSIDDDDLWCGMFAFTLVISGRPKLGMMLAEDHAACLALRREHRERWRHLDDVETVSMREARIRLLQSADIFARTYFTGETVQ